MSGFPKEKLSEWAEGNGCGEMMTALAVQALSLMSENENLSRAARYNSDISDIAVRDMKLAMAERDEATFSLECCEAYLAAATAECDGLRARLGVPLGESRHADYVLGVVVQERERYRQAIELCSGSCHSVLGPERKVGK